MPQTPQSSRSAPDDGLKCLAVLSCASILTGLGSPPCAGQGLPCRYEIDQVFGPICGNGNPAGTHGYGVSDLGDLCGYHVCSPGPDHSYIAWGAATLTTLSIPGATESRAQDTEGSVIVGDYHSPSQASGFRLQGTTFTNIPTLPGGNNVEVARMNAAGIVVGSWGNTVTGPFVFPRAFRWQGGMMQDLAPDLTSGLSRAYDISDGGAITGFMGQTAFPSNAHAFIWQNGRVTDLGLMPGSIGTEGRGINNNNQVCGIAWFTAANPAGYVRRGFVWHNGVFTDLGTFPGYTELFPSDITDDGTIVGWASTAPGGSGNLSFVWKAGILRDLTPMLTGAPSVYVYSARAINSAGQVADTAGVINLPNRGARLRPVLREPGDTNCDTIVNINDLLAVLNNWGASGVDADVNADMTVNIDDLLIVINNWG